MYPKNSPKGQYDGKTFCYVRADDALADAQGEARCRGIAWGVAYRQGKGWFLYDLRSPELGENDAPEFMCTGQTLPLALSEQGVEVMTSIMAEWSAADIRATQRADDEYSRASQGE